MYLGGGAALSQGVTVIETAWRATPRPWVAGLRPLALPRARRRAIAVADLARFWVRRYGPAEVGGTAVTLLAAGPLQAAGAPLAVVVLVAVLAESLGFHGVTAVGAHRELRRSASVRSRRAATSRTVALLVAGFGPAERIDTLLLRPALVALAVVTLGGAGALLAGKIAADLAFVVVAAPATTLSRRLRGWAGRAAH